MTRTLPLRSALVVLLASLAVAPAASARPDSAARLQMIWPASGTVTTRFGEWRGSRRHAGIDIGMLRSLGLSSILPGTVEQVGYVPGYEGYGNVVMVDIGSGYTLLYAHLSVAHVVPGQWLEAGAPIGQAGCTGSCTGTHLHFELRRNGVPIDPFPYVR